MPQQFRVGVKAVMPPDDIGADRHIAINETFKHDPDQKPGVEIVHPRIVTADPDFAITQASLMAGLITGMTRYTSNIAEDKSAVTIGYAVRDPETADAPPDGIDAWIMIAQEKHAENGR